MKHLLKICLLLTAAVMLGGCWSHPGTISMATTPLNPEDTYTVVAKNASGSDYAFLLLTFPIGHPDTQAALNKALRQYKADALINVTTDNAYCSFIFFTIERTIIHGDAIKITRYGKMLTK